MPTTKEGVLAQEMQLGNSVQMYPTTTYTGGPVRGYIENVRPGAYVLVWKSQPGRRGRPHKLKRRFWLAPAAQDLSFGSMLHQAHLDVRSNTCAEAVEPGNSDEVAQLDGSTGSIIRIGSSEGPAVSDRPPERQSPSFAGGVTAEAAAETEATSTHEIASQSGSTAPKDQLGASLTDFEREDTVHHDDCDVEEDSRRNVSQRARPDLSWWWAATLCAGIAVGSLLCTRVATRVHQL